MADYTKFIPFVFHFAAGVPPESLRLPAEAQFGIARKRGWSDDPLDRGGETMIDVTLDTYRAYCRRKGYPAPTAERLRNITFAQWREVLKTMFWDRMKADGIESQGIANLCVDWLWASGPARIKNIQRIVGVKADGVVGPKTIAAVNSADAYELFGKIREERAGFYGNIVARDPSQKKWLRGWMRRLDAINADGSFTINGERI